MRRLDFGCYCEERCAAHLYQLDPTFAVPLRMLARKSHLERVKRWLARQDQELQVRLARKLVASCRKLDRTIAALEHELEQSDGGARAGAAQAARLRRDHRVEAARRDRTCRPLHQ
jgi:hypothetical protein